MQLAAEHLVRMQIRSLENHQVISIRESHPLGSESAGELFRNLWAEEIQTDFVGQPPSLRLQIRGTELISEMATYNDSVSLKR